MKQEPIPANWKYKRLKFLSSMKSGSGITSSEIKEEGPYPVYGGNGLRGYYDTYTHNGGYALIGRQGALCGNVHKVSGKFWASEHAVVATMAGSNDVGWFAYLLHSMNLNQYSVSAAQPGLAVDRIRELPAPTPPLPEQVAIASYLDRKTAAIDSIIEKKQRLLALLEEKRAALINRAVTKGLNPNAPMKDSGVPWIGEIPEHWEVAQLGKKIQLQRGVDITKEQQTAGDVPVVSSGGVSSYHNEPIAKAPGIVVGRKGSAGTVYYLNVDYWPHDTTLWVKEFRGNVPRYAYYKLISMNLASFDTGSANPTVNRNLVHPTHVSWPPLSEQHTIADYLDNQTVAIDSIIKKETRLIELLQERRQALITAAVTGKIDVRGEEA